MSILKLPERDIIEKGQTNSPVNEKNNHKYI